MSVDAPVLDGATTAAAAATAVSTLYVSTVPTAAATHLHPVE